MTAQPRWPKSRTATARRYSSRGRDLEAVKFTASVVDGTVYLEVENDRFTQHYKFPMAQWQQLTERNEEPT